VDALRMGRYVCFSSVRDNDSADQSAALNNGHHMKKGSHLGAFFYFDLFALCK
jgi:uncharacterized membrane protein